MPLPARVTTKPQITFVSLVHWRALENTAFVDSKHIVNLNLANQPYIATVSDQATKCRNRSPVSVQQLLRQAWSPEYLRK
jgi:hypothetical protein